MKMVSTRGVKTKFQEGEKVLCYEPDPLKARVLYDSKVLEVKIEKGNAGKKIIEYLIHFNGWNSSWDRYVTEDLVLKVTPDHKKLQQKLNAEAVLQLKNRKRRQKVAEIMKINEDKKKKAMAKSKKESSSSFVASEASSDTESDCDSNKDQEIISIPEGLKRCLENDCCLINKKKKIVKLPCEPNVVTILEEYVRYYLMSLLTVQETKDDKNTIANNVSLCKEVADGLRIYFDFTLPHLLLYASEKIQYENHVKNSQNTCIINSKKLSNTSTKKRNRTPHSEKSCLSSSESASSQSLHSSTRCSSPAIVETVVSERAENKAHTKDVSRSTRVLRSAAATADAPASACDMGDGVVDACNGPQKKNVQNETSQTSLKKSDLSAENISVKENSAASDGVELITTSLKKSTVRKSCNVTTENVSSFMKDASSEKALLIRETFSWVILPQEYKRFNTAHFPSLVYGAQHLLRLFVKLPELLAKVCMDPHKEKLLCQHFQLFLNYLDEKKSDLFCDDAYRDAGENGGDTDSSAVR